MTSMLTESAELRRRLVTALVARGRLQTPHWIDAFQSVPRERFVDRFVAVHTVDRDISEHDLSSADVVSALRAIYSDSSLLTQFDAGGTATSSSTAPSLMALMLEHLDAHPGHRVLEVGTGTGYNAALLCHALGPDAVTTMDIHPQLVELAADRLGELGYTPRVEIGDGRDGAPRHGPYDRILATCGFDRVPAAWQSQLAPDGIVVINVGFGLAVLRATSAGLSGPFVDQAAFMSARTDITDTAYTAADALSLVSDNWASGEERTATWPGHLDMAAIAFLRSVLMPSVTAVEHRDEAGRARKVTLVDPISESWSVVTAVDDGGEALVTEHGPRYLWDELIALATEWNDRGRPTPDRYGLNVQQDGTHVLWLDQPDRGIRVLPQTSLQ